uniref:Glutamic acid-rich protein n=1 Tax=Strongyloides venezuelensis TaxID=75913 RepID=A0A0K0F9V9_STRVS
MIDPSEGCSKCKQFQQNALDAYAIIKRMSTQKNRSAPELAEVVNLKKLNDEQAQYIINQRKVIERISNEKDELDSSNKHLKIKNEEMSSQYNDLILQLGDFRRKLEDITRELSETKKNNAEISKKNESFTKSMEQFVLCKKMLLTTFSIIQQIKSGQISGKLDKKSAAVVNNFDLDAAYDKVGLPKKSKKKNNNKVSVPVEKEDSDDDLEKLLLAEMDMSSSEGEEEKIEPSVSQSNTVCTPTEHTEDKVENKKVTKKVVRPAISKNTRKSTRVNREPTQMEEPLQPVVEKVANINKRASNTITGRKTKSVKEQISDMDIEKIKEKYKSDMEQMKKNVEAIKKTKSS